MLEDLRVRFFIAYVGAAAIAVLLAAMYL